MINIVVTNTISKIQGVLSKGVIEALDEQLSYDVSGAQFSSKVIQGFWDGRKRLFSRTTQSFSTGLLERVQNILNTFQIPFQVQDQRAPVKLGTPIISKTKPWDWQEDILLKCLDKKRGIVKAPTGSGKGVMLVNLVGRLNNPRTIILVNKLDIMWQIMKDLVKDLEVSPGLVGGGQVQVKNITIAMVQTLARAFNIKVEGFEEQDRTKLDAEKLKMVKSLVLDSEVLIADEVHNMVAKTYYTLQRQCKKVYYKIGFSATPYRTDQADLLLEAAFGPRIRDISCSELIEKGFLAKPTFYLVKYWHNKAPRQLTYQELYEQEVVNNERRNFLIVKLAKKFWDTGKKVLIIVQQRKHGKILEEMLKIAVGEENVRYVHGDSEKEIRTETLSDLNIGKIRLVIATKIYSEGVNVPGLDVLINVKAQVSPVDFIQTIGRAMRKTSLKDKVTIVDVHDVGCRYLQRHSKERAEILQTEPAFELKMIDETKV